MIAFMIVGGIVSSRLKSKIKKYSQISTLSGMSGKEIAERMLVDNHIYDVGMPWRSGSPVLRGFGAGRLMLETTQAHRSRTVPPGSQHPHDCAVPHTHQASTPQNTPLPHHPPALPPQPPPPHPPTPQPPNPQQVRNHRSTMMCIYGRL